MKVSEGEKVLKFNIEFDDKTSGRIVIVNGNIESLCFSKWRISGEDLKKWIQIYEKAKELEGLK